MVMNFDNYIKLLRKNLERGSERTHYPALQYLLENSEEGIEAPIEETKNKAGVPDFTVRRRKLLVGYIEVKKIGANLDLAEQTE